MNGNESVSTTKNASICASIIVNMILLFAIGSSALLSGCAKFFAKALVHGTGSGEKTTWSAEVDSPDRKMVATARTVEQSGFGTGFKGTSVYLNWTTGSQSPMPILAFSEGPPGPEGMQVGISWITPTHLELTYKGQRPLDFEAVQCDGVDISVRDVLGETVKSTQ
jgi:hypothetical protein